MSGYTNCPCRDCFEISIDDNLCSLCEEAGCDGDGEGECCVLPDAEEVDLRATRWLARRAFEARALDAVNWEFIDEAPHRADEVPEFSAWLVGDETA